MKAPWCCGRRELTAGTRAVRICPPLVLNRDEAATGLEIISAALDGVS